MKNGPPYELWYFLVRSSCRWKNNVYRENFGQHLLDTTSCFLQKKIWHDHGVTCGEIIFLEDGGANVSV